MHRSLHIYEILCTIFDSPILYEAAEKADQTSSSVDRMCRKFPLLSLALTCRKFYEPATRILWRRIDGLDRLIRSMPRDVIRKEFYQGRNSEPHWPIKRHLVFKNDSTDEDWGHLDHLAAYVEEFDEREFVIRLDQGIVQALKNRYSNRGIHIFPQLRVLSCRGCKQLQCVNFLMHPELHTLRITFSRRECRFCLPAPAGGEQELLILNCLEHIHLSVTGALLVLYAPISKFLLAHATANLKSVRVDGVVLPSEVVKTILQCEALEAIMLNVTSFDLEDLFDIDMPRPNLRRFQVQLDMPVEGTRIGGGLEDGFYTRLIKKLRAPSLIDFHFFGGSQLLYAVDIKGFLQMTAGRSAQSVKLISSHRLGPIELPDNPQPHICTFANALHALIPSGPSKLEVLILNDVYVDLSDQDLGILGAFLPRLKSLVFSSRAYKSGPRKSRTTLTGLWLLAKHCENLVQVELLIDATIDWKAFRTLTGFDGDHDNSEARVEHYTLARNVNVYSLSLGESTVDEEGVATEFFRMVFPGVKNLFYAWSEEEMETDSMVKWRAIEHNLTGSSWS